MLWLRKNKSFLFVCLLVILSSPAIAGLLHPGFFLTDDGNWMIIRFSAFYEALRNGQFPPRFLLQLNHGYGYPVTDFLYPLFMYMGVPIHILGISFSNTIKVVLGASIIFSGIFTYFWLKKIVKDASALVGAVVYILAPYHLWDMYHRGSVGEVLSLAVVPFILWQIERKKFVWVAVGIALMILAHNSLAVLFLPFLIGYMVVRKSFSMRAISGIVIYALGLAAFFWIPALYDKQFTIFDKTPVSHISTYFISLSTFPLVGVIGVAILILSIPLLFKKRFSIVGYLWLVALVSLCFTLPFSDSVWKISHIAPYFQFPYRFLSVTILALAALAAFIVEILPKRLALLGVIFILGIAYFSSWNYLFPQTYQYYPDTFYSTNEDSTTVQNEYTPIWVKMQPTVDPQAPAEIFKGQGTLTDILSKGDRVTLNTILTTPATIQINKMYFPGWMVYVDGKKTSFSYNNTYGVMQFSVPSGVHSIKAVFSETPVRIFADGITLLSIILLPYLLRRRKAYETV